MADKYHYDSEGRYTGKTSDDPPSSGSGCGCGILIIIAILAVIGGKSGGGGSGGGTVPDTPVQEMSTPEPQTAPDQTPVYTPAPERQEAPHEMSSPAEPTTSPAEENPNPTDSGWVVPKEE